MTFPKWSSSDGYQNNVPSPRCWVLLFELTFSLRKYCWTIYLYENTKEFNDGQTLIFSTRGLDRYIANRHNYFSEHSRLNSAQNFTFSGHMNPFCAVFLFVKLEELHIATARKPLIHQNQPVAQYLQKNSAMHVVVYAGRLTSQRSNIEIINW